METPNIVLLITLIKMSPFHSGYEGVAAAA